MYMYVYIYIYIYIHIDRYTQREWSLEGLSGSSVPVPVTSAADCAGMGMGMIYDM